MQLVEQLVRLERLLDGEIHEVDLVAQGFLALSLPHLITATICKGMLVASVKLSWPHVAPTLTVAKSRQRPWSAQRGH